MAVTPSSMVSPQGPLVLAALWPELTDDETGVFNEGAALENISGYIADGRRRTTAFTETPLVRDDRIRAWVRYRAYGEAYETRLLLPSTVDAPDQGSSSYLATQLNALRDLRDEALVEFDAPLVPVTRAQPRQSYSARAVSEW